MYFCLIDNFRNIQIMNVIVAVSIVVSSLIMMLFQFVKNHRNKDVVNHRASLLPWSLMASALLVLVNLVMPRSLSSFSLLLDVVLGVCPVMLLSSSFWKMRSIFRATALFFVMDVCAAMMYVLTAAGVFHDPGSQIMMLLATVPLILLSGLLIFGVWRFMHNAKIVLRSGTVWQSVNLSVEYVYLAVILLSFCVAETAYGVSGHEITVYVTIVLLWLATMALSFRIFLDTAFVFCSKTERRIMESLKVSVVEVPNEITRTDTAYQEIYDRIVACFETEKLYLKSDLIIEDLVKIVFSNKLYISRAISQITGRNFCQFVNYYRIMHSIETFRKNPELKVTELANLSGFNSLVSFSMAFRLYMNENPSDWIRKERNKLAKSFWKPSN